MLDSNYNIKIIDFGDARKINEPLDDDNGEELSSDDDIAERPYVKRECCCSLCFRKR